MFVGLSRLATSRPRRTLLAAVAAIAVAGVLGASVAERLDPYDATDPQSESARADALLERAGATAGADVIAIVDTPTGARSPAGRARTAEIASRMRAQPEVAGATGPAQGPGLIARDQRSAQILVSLRPDVDEDAAGERIAVRLSRVDGVTLGGSAIAGPQINEQVGEDLTRAG
jgi:putative drug exporter of the RND superfamily